MNLKTYTFDNIEIKYEDVKNNRWFVQKDIEKLFLKYGNFYKSTESENVSLPNVLIQMYDANFNFPTDVVNFFKKSITECDDNNVCYHYLKHPTEGNLVFTDDIVATLKKKHSVLMPMKLFQDIQLNFIACNIFNEIEKTFNISTECRKCIRSNKKTRMINLN